MSATSALAPLLSLASNRQENTKPNIVLIELDDVGWGDLACYKQSKIARLKYPTPSMDYLSNSGVRFTACYAGASVCSPSRASLLTGEIYLRTGVDEVLWPENPKSLNSGVLTIPQVFGPSYASAFFGKWHMGYNNDPQNGPPGKGFGRSVWNPHSVDMTPLPLIYNDKVVVENVSDRGALSAIFTDEACKFMVANKERPFYVQLAYHLAHQPLVATKPFEKATDSSYANLLAEADFNIFKVLETLTKLELLQNTIVVLTSDNGPVEGGFGSTGGRKGFKYGTDEGSLCVPGSISWPGHIKAGQVCDFPIAHTDFLPTFASFAGASLSKKVDGVDLADFICGIKPWNDPSIADRLIPYCDGKVISAIRWRNWKMFRDGRLFNLRLTPDESLDVSVGNPQIVALMKKKYDDLRYSFTPGQVG